MVEKLSLNIKIPALNLEHNFLIPMDMEVSAATNLVIQALVEEYPGVSRSRLHAGTLMRFTTGELLPQGCSFKQLGISQGEKLILL